MSTALSYEEKIFREKAQHYLLCMKGNCSRKEHCLRWLVAQWTPDDLRIANVINPYLKDGVEGECIEIPHRQEASYGTRYGQFLREQRLSYVSTQLVKFSNMQSLSPTSTMAIESTTC